MEQASKHDLEYLSAELARVDCLIRREMRRWALAGQDPNDDYRGLYVTQAEAECLLERLFGYNWGQSITLPPDEEENFAQALATATAGIATLASDLAAQDVTPRLRQLADDFALDRSALDILLLCLAPAVDTRYERLYGYLQDNVMRRRPSVRLILDLLGTAGVEHFALQPYLHPAAPLFKFGLLEMVVEPPPANDHWINQTLQIDETIVAWLLGSYKPATSLGQTACLLPLAIDEALQAQPEYLIQPLPPLNRAAPPLEQPIVVLYGIDQLRQQATARSLATFYEQPLLNVDLEQAVNEQTPAPQVVDLVLRDARLTSAIPHLMNWEVCFANQETPPGLMAALCAHPGMVIISTATTWQAQGAARQRPFFWLACPPPSYNERGAMWRYWLSQSPSAQDLQPLDAVDAIDLLAGQFVLTSGQIRDAVAAAGDRALQQQRARTVEDLFATARAFSSPRLSALARKIEPRYHWDDIVLPADQLDILQELIATVRHRTHVLEAWGVGRKLAASAGVTVLFAGPPGTGKTMSAEVIAAELQLDLYKIDLSGVVSKYIGETEKNLERIFTEAANSNAILFFDEADALFGKRSDVKDAHDRYANIEISYLLQRMESYDGVTILATNLRGNLDEAFARRLHFAVDFPLPQVEDRLRIWQTLFPPELPRASELDFPWLARRFDLAGGNIRNVIFSAAHLAAADGQIVTMEHLLQAVRREFRKLGRLVDEDDFDVSTPSKKVQWENPLNVRRSTK